MIISTKGRYALRVMIELAKRKEEDYIPLKEIAKNQEISEKYLEAILKNLVAKGLVTGVRGKKGGYRLTRQPAEYTAWDIISATEKDFFVVSCLSPEAQACSRAANCSTLPMWQDFSLNIQNFFKGYTLEDLTDTSV